MYARRTLVTLLLTLLFCFPLYLISMIIGAPVRSTGGNFPGELSCAQSGCHVGTVNSGNGNVSITINGMPVEEFRYAPGETVPIVVTVSDPDPDRRRWGFQITTRSEADNCQPAGSLATSPADNQVQVLSTRGPVGGCPQTTVQYATHTFPKSLGSSASYEVNWTAPAQNIGGVILAAAGNAANGNNQNSGDNIYTTQVTVEPAAGGGGQDPPAISSGGVVLGNLLPTVTSISPNAIISIFGSNFAPAGTADIQPELDAQGRVATNQNGVCVEINGERSPILHLFPNQLNLQAPTLDGVLGPVSVEVTTACDMANELRSAAEAVMVENVTPAFFVCLPPTCPVDTNDWSPIAALHGGGPVVVTGAEPAAPGEFISLFATGFGPTDPPIQAGQIPMNALAGTNGLADITSDLSITIGSVPVPDEDVFYAGLAPCCAGLYQLVVKVPDSAGDGNHSVIATVDGVSTPEGTYIPVQRTQ